MDPYQQEPWHDYLLATAGAAAALAGLLFVAISLHIRSIATDPIYRGMSRSGLIGLVNVLVLSLVALVPSLRAGSVQSLSASPPATLQWAGPTSWRRFGGPAGIWLDQPSSGRALATCCPSPASPAA